MVAESKRLSGRLAWLYQARRVATQGNAAGGAIKIDIGLATGQMAELVTLRAYNSGNNRVQGWVCDEDYECHAGFFIDTTTGIGTNGNVPSIGTSATGATNIIYSAGLKMGPGQLMALHQTAAGVQNDTLIISMTLLLFNKPTEPTWSKARSTNAANVTLAASTISEANTLQQVMV